MRRLAVANYAAVHLGKPLQLVGDGVRRAAARIQTRRLDGGERWIRRSCPRWVRAAGQEGH